MRYRKVPVMVEAVQLTGERQQLLRAMVAAPEASAAWVPPWLHVALHLPQGAEGAVYFVKPPDRPSPLVVRTREGVVAIEPDAWLIQGVAGELYPCRPEVFAVTYEAVVSDRP